MRRDTIIGMMESHPHLAVIGGGNMALAIIGGGIRRKVLDPARVAVAEPAREKHPALAALGVRVFDSAREVLEWGQPCEDAAQVLLAVKPQSLAGLAADLGGSAGDGREKRIVISILAGTSTSRVRELLGAECAVVRAMPNTPARLGEGVTAIALGAGASAGDDVFAERLFRGIGPVVIRCDESLMDAYTAVSGSGPAYVFFLAEAMARAAESVGVSRDDAEQAVRQTIIGAAALLRESDEPLEALRAAVTSKGGTTEAAVRVLNEARVMESVTRSITAARDRGRELGKAGS